MGKILVVESSPRKKDSYSRKVAHELVEKLKNKNGDTVQIRDLSESPLPHLTEENINAFFTPAENRDAKAQQSVKLSDEIVDELFAADTIIISAPMWNFNIPSVLKAWIDHIVRAGRTFSFTAAGLNPLVKNKKVYLILASGSVFSEGPFKAMDFQEPYLRGVLGFIGITDVEVIKVEGVNDPKVAELVMQRARHKIEQLTV